ncbi:MAG: hypothetical protein Q8R15_01785 [Candidatus Micrarchaeota archaeon]|nr:hypothetical protein [Candidatus Micrarchaeota archaeon]
MFKNIVNLIPPFLPVSDKQLEQNLKKAGFHCSSSQYFSACFLTCVLSLFAFTVILAVIGVSLYLALPLCIAVFVFLYFLPVIEAKRAQNKIDSVLPTCVYLTYLEITHGISAEKAVSNLDSPALLIEREKIKTLTKRGLPFNLVPLFYTGPSKHFSHFISLLANGTPAELKKFYYDLLQKQGNDLKKYAAKANLASMFFISIAAIIPALFSAFILLGPMLGFAFTSLQILLIYAVVFPLTNAVFLYCIDAFLPM